MHHSVNSHRADGHKWLLGRAR